MGAIAIGDVMEADRSFGPVSPEEDEVLVEGATILQTATSAPEVLRQQGTDGQGMTKGVGDLDHKLLASAISARPSILNLDITSLRLFASVVEQANISKASRVNNIAASAISKRISDLEGRIGVALLHRLKDGVEPTPAGAALFRHIVRVLRQLEDLDSELSEFTRGDRGQVRIWANTSAVTQFLPEDLQLYGQKYPAIGIQLREETSSVIVDAVREGFADIGIFSEHVPFAGLETRVYRRDTLMVIMPHGHELSGRPSVGMADLACHDQVGLQDGSSLQEKLINEATSAAAAMRFKVRVLSFDGIRRMVEAGLGVAVLPEGAVTPYLGTGMFAARPLDAPWSTRSLLVGYREYHSLPVVARTLVDCLAPGEEGLV